MENLALKKGNEGLENNSFKPGNSFEIGSNQEFLQSSIWENIVQKGGEETRRFGDSLLISKKINFPLGLKSKIFLNSNYQYSPRGPVFENNLEEGRILENFLELAKLIKKDLSSIFFRFEVKENIIKILEKNKDILKKNKFYLKKTIDLQPKKTLLIDLSLSEEEILKAMGQKTRYNIRLATRKGLKIIEARSGVETGNNSSFEAQASSGFETQASSDFEKDFQEFWRLMKKTASRDDFKIHSEAHYKNLLINSEGLIKLFFVEFEGERIAAGLFSFYGDKVIYLHGASDNEFRNLMAPYLLQFEIIKKAKREGFKFYDFYGIDAKKWPGVTRFKQGFGGFIYNYAGTYDLVFRPGFYFIYNFLRKIRRIF